MIARMALANFCLLTCEIQSRHKFLCWVFLTKIAMKLNGNNYEGRANMKASRDLIQNLVTNIDLLQASQNYQQHRSINDLHFHVVNMIYYCWHKRRKHSMTYLNFVIHQLKHSSVVWTPQDLLRYNSRAVYSDIMYSVASTSIPAIS